jgi:hypothetical protein
MLKLKWSQVLITYKEIFNKITKSKEANYTNYATIKEAQTVQAEKDSLRLQNSCLLPSYAILAILCIWYL